MTSPHQPGSVIDGKYRLLRHIGEGGMGTVFECENIRIRRKVAIKFLHEHVATSPEFAQRFVREARASARIGSPHICDVLDLGDLENGEKFIVMELLDGESLEERLVRVGKLTQQELAPIMFEVLEGLGAMHQVSVIHRDLKPANIFLCRKTAGGAGVKILDFGVAKMEATEEDPSGIVDMTTPGTMMGTPLYMSPEQARGARDVDGRTDLYSASVIFYRALTGDTPHTGTTLHELLFKIVLDVPKPIREVSPEVDEELANIIARGLARDPEERYSSARQYQEAVAKWGESHGLSFKVTLPSEPPPLKRQTGGFPAADIASAMAHLRGDTPPGIEPRPAGPSTPVSATANTQPATGTLLSHSEPAMIVAAKSEPTIPVAAIPVPVAAKSVAPAPASVEREERTEKRAKVPSTVSSEKRSVAPAPASNKTTIIIGAIVAVVAAIVGVKLGSANPPQPTRPPPSSSVTQPVPVSTLSVPTVSEPVVDAGAAPSAVSPPPTPGNPIVPVPTKPTATTSAKPTDMADAGGRMIHTTPNF